jgi:beta-lactamase class A
VTAAEQGSLFSISSITEEAQILPIPDGTGKYLLKSDGFYCLNEDGTLDKTPSIHYFDHFAIDGTVFDGYYYHDESGKFRAENPHMVYLKLQGPTQIVDENLEYVEVFEGCYMVNSLGKLTAAPQVRYMDNLVLNNVTYNGFYYFDEYGKLVTEAGVHYLEMTSNGRKFEGSYYFGGTNGLLCEEAGVTPDGFAYDETGLLADVEAFNMDSLQTALESLISGYEGEWSIYVKDLDNQEELVINNRQMASASLIKAFVMAKTYQDMDLVKQREGALVKADPTSDTVKQKVDTLLNNMITVSDNESFNELVRLQSEKSDFLDGAEHMNKYLAREGYEETLVQHTLSPSSTTPTGIGDNNLTSVKDCGLLLERIYNGTCVSEEASEEMLNLLLNQQNSWKIPESLDEGIKVANKTGETDSSQHDIAIVYGEKTTYILCVMSENCPKEDDAIDYIRAISRMVYNYLNIS